MSIFGMLPGCSPTLPSYTDSSPAEPFWGVDYEGCGGQGTTGSSYWIRRTPATASSPTITRFYTWSRKSTTPAVLRESGDEREHCQHRQHDPNYVPEPIYPEYIPLEDDHEFPAEEQPLPPIDSPTTESPGYVTESDPEEDPEGDDVGYEDEDEEDEEDDKEEEHLATRRLYYPYTADELFSQPEITVRPQASISLPPEAEVERLLAMTTPSPSPPISLSPPSAGERLARCTTPPFLPTTFNYAPLQPLVMPSPGDHMRSERVPLLDLPEGVRLAELHERDTQDLYALLEDAQDSRSRISQRVDMNSQRVDLLMGDRMTLQETVWMVEEEAYASREAWARSIGLSQATHQELQTHRDHVYAHETYLQAHQTQLQLQSTLIQTQHQVHETRFQMQHTELAALRETDRRRQDQMVEALRVIRDMRREMSDMQAELLALREPQRRARQPGPEARIPDHQEASGDADSHI
ncbi:hypothetical protein Tco_0746904 [Tanacetum coccineum]